MNTVISHDSLFKKFLCDIQVATDFLQIHLPASVRDICDFSSLKLEAGSFVEPNLRKHYCDVLWSVRMQGGADGYIYTLIEHQSSPDRLMAFRLFRYSVAVMQQHLEQGHQQLPVVVPLLFYHGEKSPYPHSMDWLDCFSDRKLAESVFHSPFPLVDVTAIPDEEIKTHRHVAALELVKKHARYRDILGIVPDLARVLKLWALPQELRYSLMHYLSQVGDSEQPEQFFAAFVQAAPDYREDIMTLAERLEQKGEQRGIQKGLQQGHYEAACQIARQLLASGVSRSVVQQATGLSESELDGLGH